jgi:hypothetical protein
VRKCSLSNRLDTIMITQERLEYLFTYDDGNFYHKENRGGRLKGTRAGGKGLMSGFKRMKVDGVSNTVHRMVWLYHKGSLPEQHLCIAPKDGDKLNTRISNLHIVSRGRFRIVK